MGLESRFARMLRDLSVSEVTQFCYSRHVDTPSHVSDQTPVWPGWSLGIRAIEDNDRWDIQEFLQEYWGSTQMVTRGRILEVQDLPGFIAPSPAGDLNGLITLDVSERGCEIVTMNSVHRGRGIGTNLMSCAEIFASQQGAKCLWLVTTNDNVDAMAFYMRRGFRMVAIHKDAVRRSRELKPSIPMIGHHGIAIHDEIEFEKILSN